MSSNLKVNQPTSSCNKSCCSFQNYQGDFIPNTNSFPKLKIVGNPISPLFPISDVLENKNLISNITDSNTNLNVNESNSNVNESKTIKLRYIPYSAPNLNISENETKSNIVKLKYNSAPNLNTNKTKFRTCGNTIRHHRRSKFPLKKVPLENFQNPKRDGSYFSHCLDCRLYANRKKVEKKLKLREEVENKAKLDPNFRMCISTLHPNTSKYPQDKVPIEMFYNANKTKLDKGEIVMCDECSDCRTHIYEVKAQYKARLEAEAEEKDMCVCTACYMIVPLEDMYYNEEKNRLSRYCIKCSGKNIISNKKVKGKLRELYFKIIQEFILKYNSSCQRCKSIFLKPEPGTKYVVELPTYEVDGMRYVIYKDTTYLVEDFLKKYIHLLEFRIIDFDHLTEKEQRERGLLLEGEVYIPKLGSVCRMNSETPMRDESKKCQHTCCRCHTIITAERFDEIRGNQPRKLTENQKIRKEYVDKIKENGCEVCGFYDSNPLLQGFIEMDHRDPLTKKMDVCRLMAGSGTFQDLIDECDICGPKCRFCHRIHSDEQRKAGLIKNY